MCPEGMTTSEDGQATCNITLAPATNLEKRCVLHLAIYLLSAYLSKSTLRFFKPLSSMCRYAVVVYFSVTLTDVDLEAIVLKVSVLHLIVYLGPARLP